MTGVGSACSFDGIAGEAGPCSGDQCELFFGAKSPKSSELEQLHLVLRRLGDLRLPHRQTFEDLSAEVLQLEHRLLREVNAHAAAMRFRGDASSSSFAIRSNGSMGSKTLDPRRPELNQPMCVAPCPPCDAS